MCGCGGIGRHAVFRFHYSKPETGYLDPLENAFGANLKQNKKLF